MNDVLKKLGIEPVNPGAFNGRWFGSDSKLESISPIDGKPIAAVMQATPAEYEQVMAAGGRVGRRHQSEVHHQVQVDTLAQHLADELDRDIDADQP